MQVSEKLYEHIRNTCACIDDALSSETLADINDYLSMAEHSANSAFDMIEKQVTPQTRAGDEWVNMIDDACDKRYSEEYANGEYCHEQSFKWGFQEGVEWLEKQDEQSSVIRWYDASLIPQEMEELLVEWDSEDSTWHEIAFYHADTKTFWNGERQVENVTRWCYIVDLLGKQGKKVEPIEGFNSKFERQISRLIASAINKEHEYNEGYVKWTANALLEYAKRELEKQGEKKSEEEVDNLHNYLYGEQNLAWSEEDERKITELKTFIAKCNGFNRENREKAFGMIDSLRPQNRWKPSEEQMKILYEVLNFAANHESPHWNNYIFGTLNELIRQLKRLRKE